MGRPMIEWAVRTAQVGKSTAAGRGGWASTRIDSTVAWHAGCAMPYKRKCWALAMRLCRRRLRGQADVVLVTYGDMPLLQGETLQKLLDLFYPLP